MALGEAEELQKDLSKTIHQMDNLDMELQRSVSGAVCSLSWVVM